MREGERDVGVGGEKGSWRSAQGRECTRLERGVGKGEKGVCAVSLWNGEGDGEGGA